MECLKIVFLHYFILSYITRFNTQFYLFYFTRKKLSKEIKHKLHLPLHTTPNILKPLTILFQKYSFDKIYIQVTREILCWYENRWTKSSSMFKMKRQGIRVKFRTSLISVACKYSILKI